MLMPESTSAYQANEPKVDPIGLCKVIIRSGIKSIYVAYSFSKFHIFGTFGHGNKRIVVTNSSLFSTSI